LTSTVIVLSYRPGPWLVRCLDSVLPQATEVLVVDNGSPGREAGALAARAGAKVVRSAVNLGFAGGVNLGLEHARSDVIALLNDDAVAEPGWLAAAAGTLQDPGVAAVSPKILLAGTFGEVRLHDDAWFAPGDRRPLGRQLRSVTVDGVDVLDKLVGPGVHGLERGAAADGTRWRWTTGSASFFVPLPEATMSAEVRVNAEPAEVVAVTRVINNAGCYLRRDGYAGDYGLESRADGRFDRTAERFGLTGTALVTTSDVVGRIGGLAHEFFAYYEDVDWSWRARLAGLRLLYDPRATVHHLRSATSGGTANVRLLAERNRLLCLMRNAPAPVAGRFLWRRVVEGPGEGVRRQVARRLPWAVASRRRLRPGWTVSPEQVWERWAGVDVQWDSATATS
jgi:GT2 family glycosyltransferase